MTTINVLRGEDKTISITWTDSAGDPLVLSDVEVFDASQVIAGQLSITEVDLAGGRFDVVLNGGTLIPVGTYSFRVKAVSGGDDIAVPMVTINVT